MTKRIEIETTKREKITIALGGKEYVIMPPKAYQTLLVASRTQEANEMEAIQVILDWIEETFTASQSKDILARLNNPKDDLDFPDITQLFKKVLEASVPGNLSS